MCYKQGKLIDSMLACLRQLEEESGASYLKDESLIIYRSMEM